MEQNCQRYNLKELFAQVVLNGVNEENKENLELYLIDVLDNRDTRIFNSALFYNFILMLKRQSNTTFLLEQLIQEVELKSFRLMYLNLDNDGNTSCDAQQPYNNKSSQRQSKPLKELEGLNQFNVSPVSKILEDFETTTRKQD